MELYYFAVIKPLNGVFGNYDEDYDEDCERFDYELPNKIFKYLFKFISQIINRGRDVIINNFEILIKICNNEVNATNEDESFRFGNVSFNKLIPSSVKKQLENDRKAKRREMVERNFDKRDDWTNVNHIVTCSMNIMKVQCLYLSLGLTINIILCMQFIGILNH